MINGINIPKPDEGWLYLDAVVLIKCMDDTGKIRFKEMKSDGLSHMEALGMAISYSDSTRKMLERRGSGGA